MPLPIVENKTADKIWEEFLKLENLEEKIQNFELKHTDVASFLQSVMGYAILTNLRPNITLDIFDDYQSHDLLNNHKKTIKLTGNLGSILVYDLLETEAANKKQVLPAVTNETILSYKQSICNKQNTLRPYTEKVLQHISKVNPEIANILSLKTLNNLLKLPIQLSGGMTYTLLERQAESDELEKMI